MALLNYSLIASVLIAPLPKVTTDCTLPTNVSESSIRFVVLTVLPIIAVTAEKRSS